MTAPPTPPKHLGRYEVLEPLASGGMATIYVGRARDDAGASRLFALKVTKEEFLRDPHYVDMFRDEAKILSRLSHPNIVETIEANLGEGAAFIAMELILGRAVADLSDEHTRRGTRIPNDLSAWICARVADALDYAHRITDEDGERLEVIHRDANPTNILVTYEGRVKLIDFGLAKATGRSAKSTRGIVKGKVPYLSPEQIKERVIDHRTDLYTLGATLWELTTGRRLWKRDTDVATVLAIRDGKVPDPTELVPGYPEELWAIIWEALMPQRDDRYADAATMARDLDSFVRRTSEPARMEARAAALVEECFPGERSQREAWAQRLRG
ncbi:MAG TPA: serine/threonine-protein kinase [Polyangiaceae bacterium]